MYRATNNILLLMLFLLVLAIVSLFTRGLIPVDETRYTTVAWEMWLRGDFLVPHLNGETYSHKPPLLFWLMHLGWKLFGVNEWWPRLIPYIFSFAALVLVQQLGRRLWPETDAWLMAPFVVLGFTIWAFFSSAVMFDMMLAFFVLLAITGIHRVVSGDGSRWWLLIGVAWGLGVLSKGPVIFVHTLPLLLLARYWAAEDSTINWKQMLAGSLLAFIIAALIVFAWVVPAIMSGGEEYAQSLLFGQNIERALQAPNDALPWWYYVAFMPFILFPWAYWAGNWKALRQSGGDAAGQQGRRFCLAWIVPVLLLFSLISGKKVHYLLPVLPAVALYLSSLLANRVEQSTRRQMWLLTVLYLCVAVGIAVLPYYYGPAEPPYWLQHVSSFAVIPFVLIAVAGQYFIHGSRLRAVQLISFQTLLLLIAAHFTLFVPAMQGYDLKPVAEEISRLQDGGYRIAHNGKYRGEYHFLGRLEKPLDVVYDHTEQQWLNEHPDGYVIAYRYQRCGKSMEPAEYQRLFRNAQCVTIRTSEQHAQYLQQGQ